jgi:hypothetical protein
MKVNLVEERVVQVLLSRDGDAIIQQEDKVIRLDREQIETVIQLLRLAKVALRNSDKGRF